MPYIDRYRNITEKVHRMRAAEHGRRGKSPVSGRIGCFFHEDPKQQELLKTDYYKQKLRTKIAGRVAAFSTFSSVVYPFSERITGDLPISPIYMELGLLTITIISLAGAIYNMNKLEDKAREAGMQADFKSFNRLW